ncbi:hypothetical protein GCM10010885_06360 [Alicyclobacillus cellulosilyticus]|uniref:DUF1284 domain-containing protein n=1 Tax=Alicyclobacillus cellulosilyticus TaxID=1003997 RepID=A0A917NH00_9BACL|nr:DUF1284 domain-containing protein [Alicyclobacillus cellulosilyticus]GGI99813.1 hypothetical protein GCM10010885_06360 [Alicyclobacillus cellulosilyticus]
MKRIRLRGHHLLCLLGYRGMGYSAAFTANMTRIHATLRRQPDTLVELVDGPDDLCDHFPPDQPRHCEDGNVQRRDAAVLAQSGLSPGDMRPWRELEVVLGARFVPADIPRLCSTCPWLPYGVCEDGLRRIRAGEGLFPVGDGTHDATRNTSCFS